MRLEYLICFISETYKERHSTQIEGFLEDSFGTREAHHKNLLTLKKEIKKENKQRNKQKFQRKKIN